VNAQDILTEGLLELGRKDARVLLLDCDEADQTGALKFRDAFPERFLQAGVSPASLAGMAKGLAAAGEFTPLIAGQADTLARRMTDHLAGLGDGRRVKLVGLVRPGEGSGRDLAVMRSLGTVAVYEAADAKDAAALLVEFAAADGAAYLRVPLWEGPASAGVASLGRTAALRDGDDVTVIASGFAMAAAAKACEKLAAQKVKVRLGHARALSPLDRDYALDASRHTLGIVTAEDHWPEGGLGSAVAECVTDERPCVVKRICRVKGAAAGEAALLEDMERRILEAARYILENA